MVHSSKWGCNTTNNFTSFAHIHFDAVFPSPPAEHIHKYPQRERLWEFPQSSRTKRPLRNHQRPGVCSLIPTDIRLMAHFIHPPYLCPACGWLTLWSIKWLWGPSRERFHLRHPLCCGSGSGRSHPTINHHECSSRELVIFANDWQKLWILSVNSVQNG